MKYIKYISIALVLITIAFSLQRSQPVSASVSQGSDYIATTTGQLTASTSDLLTINNTSGTFGSVIITGVNTGTMNFYDGTSTANANARLLASFPTNAAVGTYTFDVRYSLGLVIGFTGTIATSTITYR